MIDLDELRSMPLPEAAQALRRSLAKLEQLIDDTFPDEEERAAFRAAIAPILAEHRADAAGLDELEAGIRQLKAPRAASAPHRRRRIPPTALPG